MKNFSEIFKNYPTSVSYYWKYQYRLGKEFLVPYFKKMGIELENKKILEVGAGEGGILTSFSECKVKEAIGFDLREEAVKNANDIANDLETGCKYYVHDIYKKIIPDEWNKSFDIIILRDVIEHLDETEDSLGGLKRFLKDNGIIFITFPPYYSAFGAHQHLLNNLPGKIPFIQILPSSMFYIIIKKGREADRIEAIRLRKIKLTIKKFRKAVANNDFNIIDERLFLFRPVFKIKFGLPVLSLGIFKYFPFFRELFSTEASYLLQTKEN